MAFFNGIKTKFIQTALKKRKKINEKDESS